MNTATAGRQAGLKRRVPLESQGLDGLLTLPSEARGLVILVPGSGSSHLSPRNRYVAQALNGRGFGTLSFTLLSQDEARDSRNLFDIAFLGHRVIEAIDQMRHEPATCSLLLALFGFGTGAAAALVAAAERPEAIAGVISCSGRPDLAGHALKGVRIPTLQIAGGADRETLAFNERAIQALAEEKCLHLVPGASHLFQERGAFDEVVEVTGDWLESRLGPPISAPPTTDPRTYRTARL